MRRAASALLAPAASVAAAIALSGVVVGLAGGSPPAALRALWDGAFGSTYALWTVVAKTTPLLFTGVAVAVAFRGGFWNIGAEGQFTMGAIAAAAVGLSAPRAPGAILLPVALLAAVAAGATWCLAAAWLRTKRGANEVITTIMLNFVAVYFLSYCVHGPLQEASGAQPVSGVVPSSMQLARIAGPQYPAHAGIFIALAAAIIFDVFLVRTTAGYRVRAVGLAPEAARLSGISVPAQVLLTAALSGGLAGLAGAVEIAGVFHRLYDRVSAGYGYTAIAVALLARLRPAAVLPAAIFFGALDAGSSRLQQEAGVSYVVVLVVQAIVILASVAAGVAPSFRRRERAETGT
jgi:ABC-type uncharacterized transport system permease subunit